MERTSQTSVCSHQSLGSKLPEKISDRSEKLERGTALLRPSGPVTCKSEVQEEHPQYKIVLYNYISM